MEPAGATGDGGAAAAAGAGRPVTPDRFSGRAWIALVALFASISAALVYPPITKYDLYDKGLGGRDGDVGQYVRLYRGEPLAAIPRPFRYRVLTPALARVVPMPPQGLLRFFDLSDDKLVQYRFGMANLLGLTAAGALFVGFAGALGFAPLPSLLCALCFYTAFPVVNYGGTAMVEAWGWAFLLLGCWAAVRDRPALLGVAALLGPLAKETTLLVLPVLLLLPGPLRAKWPRLAAMVPGIALYAVFRLVVAPGGYGFPSDPATAFSNLAERLQRGPYLWWILFDGGTAFGVLLPFAAVGLASLRGGPPSPLRRLAWLVPVVFAVPFVLGTNIGRIWFYAFPVLIPLAVLGLGRLSGAWSATGATGPGRPGRG